MEDADVSENNVSSMDPTIRNMIATMTRKIADRCECQYWPGGTFAFPTNAANKVFKAYGYSSVTLAKAYNKNIEDKIVSMLIGNKPVFIAAASTDVFHAHAWVIDGFFSRYKRDNHDITQTFFHCNLGWKGYCDGYYYSGIFDTNNCPYKDTKSGGAPGFYNNTWRIITYDLNK